MYSGIFARTSKRVSGLWLCIFDVVMNRKGGCGEAVSGASVKSAVMEQRRDRAGRNGRKELGNDMIKFYMDG